MIHGDDFLLYEAMIDTTFALYRSFVTKHLGVFRNQIRMGYPYVAKHMPWYERENHMPEDSLYYQQTANIESTWYKEELNNDLIHVVMKKIVLIFNHFEREHFGKDVFLFIFYFV